MTPDHVKVALEAAQLLLALAGWIVALYIARSRATRHSITGLDRRIDGVEERVTRAEKDLEHAPTRRDIEKLYETINPIDRQLSGLISTVGAMQGTLESVGRGVQMVQDYLLNRTQNDRSGDR